MNRILARRMSLTPTRAGGFPKRTHPEFAINWKHPSPGIGRQHMLNDECATAANINNWRSLVVKGPFGPAIGSFIVSIKFYAWAAIFFSVPFLSLGHNAYKRYGAPNVKEE